MAVNIRHSWTIACMEKVSCLLTNTVLSAGIRKAIIVNDLEQKADDKLPTAKRCERLNLRAVD